MNLKNNILKNMIKKVILLQIIPFLLIMVVHLNAVKSAKDDGMQIYILIWLLLLIFVPLSIGIIFNNFYLSKRKISLYKLHTKNFSTFTRKTDFLSLAFASAYVVFYDVLMYKLFKMYTVGKGLNGDTVLDLYNIDKYGIVFSMIISLIIISTVAFAFRTFKNNVSKFTYLLFFFIMLLYVVLIINYFQNGIPNFDAICFLVYVIILNMVYLGAYRKFGKNGQNGKVTFGIKNFALTLNAFIFFSAIILLYNQNSNITNNNSDGLAMIFIVTVFALLIAFFVGLFFALKYKNKYAFLTFLAIVLGAISFSIFYSFALKTELPEGYDQLFYDPYMSSDIAGKKYGVVGEVFGDSVAGTFKFKFDDLDTLVKELSILGDYYIDSTTAEVLTVPIYILNEDNEEYRYFNIYSKTPYDREKLLKYLKENSTTSEEDYVIDGLIVLGKLDFGSLDNEDSGVLQEYPKTQSTKLSKEETKKVLEIIERNSVSENQGNYELFIYNDKRQNENFYNSSFEHPGFLYLDDKTYNELNSLLKLEEIFYPESLTF